MNETIKCLRCQAEMEVGFIVDRTYGENLVSKWVAGEPEAAFISGVKIRGKASGDVATYRCTKCGLLESFARDVAE